MAFDKLHALLCAQLEAALTSWDVASPRPRDFSDQRDFFNFLGNTILY